MQRRKFTQLVFSGLTVGLGACASPASAPTATQSSAPAVAEPKQAQPTPAAATPQTQPTQVVAATSPTAASVAAVLIQPTPPPQPLPDGPVAPYIESDTWLNVAQPITWDSLRGTVTMVEFWTFG